MHHLPATPSARRPSFVLPSSFFALLLLLLPACTDTPAHIRQAVDLYQAGQYPQAAQILQPDAAKKDEDFVLNNCRYGSCVLAAGQRELAEGAFMNAYDVINGVKTNDTGRKLAAAIVFENFKVWKGEPFERAMAHYYLGVALLLKDPPDYDNARAAFQNSLFKLRDYATDSKKQPIADQYKTIESNFALGHFGLGLCYFRQGDTQLADANFKVATDLEPELAGLVTAVKNPQNNVLVFVDYGRGPRRKGQGLWNSQSIYGPPPSEAGAIPGAGLIVDGKAATEPLRFDTVDTLALAQDQKWQDIDTIRTTKAIIGTGALVGGGAVTAYGAQQGDATTALIGVGIMAIGAAVSASSQADIRYWEMLPRTVYVLPASLPPGDHSLQINIGGAVGTVHPITVKPNAPTILYLRIR